MDYVYKIRAGKDKFDNPHYVTTIKRFKDGTISDIKFSQCAKGLTRKKALYIWRILIDIDVYCMENDKDSNFYQIEKIKLCTDCNKPFDLLFETTTKGEYLCEDCGWDKYNYACSVCGGFYNNRNMHDVCSDKCNEWYKQFSDAQYIYEK
jgi:hypothetical protein